jgi:phosphoserine phosphatase
MPITLIHSAELSDTQRRALGHALGTEPRPCDGHHRVEHSAEVPPLTLEALRVEQGLDINTLPADFDPTAVRLFITDMDSTLINIECVDEIADFAGLKSQVAAITEAAMRGELDFAASLRKRVALLEGLDMAVLERVYEERLRLNPGAETLVAGLKVRGIKLALVSGGFTFFTTRLQARLGLDYTFANVLAQADGKLLGQVEGYIVGAEAKAAFLQQLCEELDIHPHQAIAMGDGANDLHMLAIAGLGVAYHAKPAVRAQTHTLLQHRGLDAVLDFFATSSTISAEA